MAVGDGLLNRQRRRTSSGEIQFDACVTKGLTTIQPGVPAVGWFNIYFRCRFTRRSGVFPTTCEVERQTRYRTQLNWGAAGLRHGRGNCC